MGNTQASSSDPTLGKLEALLPDLEALYKDVHSHPELSMQEMRTARLAADHLRAAGYEVTTGVGKTGVVGLLRNGDGPTVMLRADMDALPLEKATGLCLMPAKQRLPIARAKQCRCRTCVGMTCM
jgi:metal-dependent amidase/aminoacylase/carboxypeptidase family protein